MSEVTLKDGQQVKQKKHKKKHYWWRYLLTFFGGFLFCLGAIGGGAAIFATVLSTRDVAKMAGVPADKYLASTYLDDTLLNSIMRIADHKFENLGDIEDISPYIKTLIEDLNTDVLEPNLHFSLDWNELKTKPFTKAEDDTVTVTLADYIPKAFKDGIKLVSFVGDGTGENLDKVMKYFLYNTSRDADGNIVYGNAYSLTDIIDNDVFNTKMDDMRIKDIADLDDSPFSAQMGDWTIKDFSNNPDEKIKTLKIGLLFSEEEASDNPLIQTLRGKIDAYHCNSCDKDYAESELEAGHKCPVHHTTLSVTQKDWTIKALTNFENINNLKINQILDVSESSGLLNSIQNYKIRDLQNSNFVDSLLIKDIFVEPTGLLKTLAERDCYTEEWNHYFGSNSFNDKLLEGEVNYYSGHGEPTDKEFNPLKPRDLVNNYDGDVYVDLDASHADKQDLWIYEKYGWRHVSGFTVGDLNNVDKILELKVSDVFNDMKEGDLIYTFKDKSLKELSTIEPNQLKLTEIYSIEQITGWQKVKEEDKDLVVNQYSSSFIPGGHANYFEGDAIPTVSDPSGALIKDEPNGVPGDLYHNTHDDDYYIKVGEGNRLLSSLFGNNNNVTIGDLSDFETIKGVELSSVMDADGNQILTALFSLKDEYDQPIKVTVGNVAEKIKLLTLKDVVTFEDPENRGILGNIIDNIGGTKLDNLSSAFEGLKLNQIFTIDSHSPQVLQSLQNYTLSTLSDGLDKLMVKDVMNIKVGDIYIDDDASIGEELYIYHENGWEQVLPTDYNKEYNDYFVDTVDLDDNPIICYVNAGKCEVYHGNGAPTLDSTDLVARDSLYGVKDIRINDSNELIEELKNNLKLKDVCDIDDNSPEVLKQLKNTKLVDISEKVKKFTLNDLIGTSMSSSPILKVLGGVTVFGDGDNNLEFALEHLNLFDILGDQAFEDITNPDNVRNAVKLHIELNEEDFEGNNLTGSIKELHDTINYRYHNRPGLENTQLIVDKTMKEMFLDYVTNPYGYDPDYVNDAIRDAYYEVTNSIMTAEQEAQVKNGVFTFEYYGHKVTLTSYKACRITASFWFLFTEEGEHFDNINDRFILQHGLTYTINDMSKLTANMTYHIQNETLYDLDDAGFLNLPDGFNLDAVLKDLDYYTFHIDIPGSGNPIGSLTIKGILDIINAFMPYITVQP